MDRELPVEVIRKRRVKRFTGLAGAIVLLVLGFLGLRAAISPTLDRSRLLTSIAEIGPIEATVSASGVVVPEFEEVLTAPVASTIETVHIRSGDSVRAGQSILQLNTDQLRLAFQKVCDELEIQKNKKKQMVLSAKRTREDLQAAYDIKELRMQFAASKNERAQHLFDIGGITRAELDLAALDLEIAKRELAQLADQVENQHATDSATQRELDLQISVQENSRSATQRQLDLAEVRAGRKGILTWVNDDIGASVNSGDDLARIADLSSFKVEASISDVHAGKLVLGGATNVRIGDHNLRGRIASVRPAVQNGIVTFVVELDDKSDAILRPNLRADVFVVTSTKDKTIRVQKGPFYNGYADQEVFVIEGDKAVKRVVDIGLSNFDWVEIIGDVQAGDEVIISDTKKYRHRNEIAIR